MDRRTIAQSFSTAIALPLALHAEAEAELSASREEVAQLRAALAQEKAGRAADREVAFAEMRDRLSASKAEFDAHEQEVADYERTVAGLRESLRVEEARRASYQAVDAAARRLVQHALANRVEETRSDPGTPCVKCRCVRIGMMAEVWESLRDACERA